MSRHAGIDALVAAGATIKINEHQVLALGQAQVLNAPRLSRGGNTLCETTLVSYPLFRDQFQLPFQARIFLDQIAELYGADPNQLYPPGAPFTISVFDRVIYSRTSRIALRTT